VANKILWETSPTSRGTVLTTELNALANGAYSAVGTEIDNATNLDQYGSFEVNLASLTPTSGAYVQLFITQAVGGTNYEDAPSSTNPGYQMSVGVLSVATGAATKRVTSPWFRLPPGKFKVVLLNGTGAALAANTNTVTLYTDNDEIQ
jgi:hypothetical protein